MMFGWWLWFMCIKGYKYHPTDNEWWWDVISVLNTLFMSMIFGPIILMVYYYAQLRDKRNSIDQAKQQA